MTLSYCLGFFSLCWKSTLKKKRLKRPYNKELINLVRLVITGKSQTEASMIGSLSNEDGDGNENGKKGKGLF